MFFKFKKKEKYNIDLNSADRILQGVFAESHVEPNTVSFENIVKRSRLNLVSDNIYLFVTAFLFVAILLCPLFMPKGSVFMSVEPSKGRELSIVSHTMSNGLFSITLDGAMIDVTETYIVDAEGNESAPVSYDSSNNTLVFSLEQGEHNIYIYDIDGRCLHLLLHSFRAGRQH
ncbi:MAG: hypothetical protein K5796_05975 [Lachnospiraceae bacterium]|nr:hypothetical protein [Lachnospiraceae bacterium]